MLNHCKSIISCIASGALFSVFTGLSVSHAELKNLEWSGWAWLTEGRVMKSAFMEAPNYQGLGTIDTTKAWGHVYNSYDYNGLWLTDLHMGVKLEGDLSDHASIVLHGGGLYLWNTIALKNANTVDARNASKVFVPYLIETSLTHRFENQVAPTMLKFGYFSVKYNDEVKNLGEYLFRTSPYPQLFHTPVGPSFEVADKAKVLGLMLENRYWDVLTSQFFLHSETDIYPMFDFSFSGILEYQPAEVLKLGGGFSFHHLFAVDEQKTTPGTNDSLFKSSSEDYFARYIDDQGDTTLYTFRGTKLMLNATVDIKPLLGNPSILGSEDLKIYSEAAVLGVENYPGIYENLKDRIPIMLGFNFPAFKLLDVLALEVEWFGGNYSNSDYFIWRKSSPSPYLGEAQEVEYARNNQYPWYEEDDWKWSVYASKKLTSYFALSAQIANDHTKRNKISSSPVYEEVTQRLTDWYWVARAKFFF